MLNPRIINRTLIILIPTIISIIAIMAAFEDFRLEVTRLIKIVKPVNITLFVFTFIAITLSVAYIINVIIFKTKEKYIKIIKNKEEELHRQKIDIYNLRNELDNIEVLRLTDVITGIPNQARWEKDIENIKNQIQNPELSALSSVSTYYIALIDLDNFSLINKKFGFIKGDKIIRRFSRTTYLEMRRNEEMYKRNPNKQFDDKLTGRMYRRYIGGDEFFFIIRGKESDAIGFLNRLHKSAKSRRKLYMDIINIELELTFHAAICPIFKQDKVEDVFERLDKCYTLARDHADGLKIYWFSKTRPEFRDNSTRGQQIYDEAESLFKA